LYHLRLYRERVNRSRYLAVFTKLHIGGSKFCTFEGATKITVDLYVLGREAFDGGESE
jgi:hypothetical protein